MEGLLNLVLENKINIPGSLLGLTQDELSELLKSLELIENKDYIVVNKNQYLLSRDTFSMCITDDEMITKLYDIYKYCGLC
jgi:hypothetical protein